MLLKLMIKHLDESRWREKCYRQAQRSVVGAKRVTTQGAGKEEKNFKGVYVDD